MRRDDRFLVLLERKENRRDQVGEGFANARTRFDDKMSIFLQRFGYRHRHLLLLRPELEVFCLRKQPLLGKDCPDPFDKFCSEGIFERDHLDLA